MSVRVVIVEEYDKYSYRNIEDKISNIILCLLSVYRTLNVFHSTCNTLYLRAVLTVFLVYLMLPCLADTCSQHFV